MSYSQEIAWGDGTGDKIYLTASASEGNQTVLVSSDANTGAARTKTITFTSGVGSITKTLTVSQEAGEIRPNHACLTFKSAGTNTLSMTCNGTAAPVLYYSTNGTTWTLWNYSSLSFSDGSPLFLYGSNTSGFSSSSSNYAQFVIGGSSLVNIEGNIMVLIDGTGDELTIPNTYCFYDLFYNCTKLKTPPSFPATTLKGHCYHNTFWGCSGLTSVPELPALTIADNCYNQMFYACRGLVTAQSILPATTLESRCYQLMFYNCTKLTTAPVLPALTLVSNCYNQMFNTCSKLNYVKAMFTTTPSNSYTTNWLNKVASTGTFVKNSTATWTNTGANAVPSGWTIQTASS